MDSLSISIFESFLSGGRVGSKVLRVQKALLKACKSVVNRVMPGEPHLHPQPLPGGVGHPVLLAGPPLPPLVLPGQLGEAPRLPAGDLAVVWGQGHAGAVSILADDREEVRLRLLVLHFNHCTTRLNQTVEGRNQWRVLSVLEARSAATVIDNQWENQHSPLRKLSTTLMAMNKDNGADIFPSR